MKRTLILLISTIFLLAACNNGQKIINQTKIKVRVKIVKFKPS